MKTGKVISIGRAGVSIIIIAAGVFLWSSLDKIVEAAIEKYGSQATQTKVEVGGVNIKQALTSGEGSISNIKVGNPKGFEHKQIFTLGSTTVGIDPETVTKKVIVVKKIIVSAPHVFYEINDKGVSNLDELKKNVEQATASLKGSGSEKSAESSEEVKLIVRKLVIDKGEIDAKVAALGGKKLSANLPRIELNNLGQDTGGATPATIAEKVIKVLITKIYPEIAKLGLKQYLGISAEDAKAQLQEKADAAKKQLEDKAKGALGGSGVQDQVGDKLKGLFGK